MGATSVTGVGPGSAAIPGGGMKGSTNVSVGVANLIGPRTVICKDVTLDSGGHGHAYFPELPVPTGSTVEDTYCVFLQGQKSTYPYYGNFTASSFGVTGGANDTVCYNIVKTGFWGVTNSNLSLGSS